MKISVFGLGYVGLSNALLLSQKDQVMGYDLDQAKLASLQKGKSPIQDAEISDFLTKSNLSINWTSDFETAVQFGDWLLIATPTDYDESANFFNTSSIESVIQKALEIKPSANFLIKSTIPIGYIKSLKKRFAFKGEVIFSPEFLREGRALLDNLEPSRIIIGSTDKSGKQLGDLFLRNSHKSDVPVLYTDETEAEAIKLFANTYLAMRVAYFNELDSFATLNDLSSEQIIKGIGFDPRIGSHYNNPSFGYGGYCLPKDTKQLKANFENVPERLMTAIVESNQVRHAFVAEEVIKKGVKTVGIFRLAMKHGSDNFRQSAIQHIMRHLAEKGIQLFIYEPMHQAKEFNGHQVIKDLKEFKEKSELILANRFDALLQDVQNKVHSPDVFARD